MAVERFLEFFAAAIDERPDAGRVWSGGGAVPGVVFDTVPGFPDRLRVGRT